MTRSRARPGENGAAPVVDRAIDGTRLYAPCGELPVEVDGSVVQCHLCGRWLHELGGSHVVHAHGLTADAYRRLAGLRPRHPLSAPALSAARAARMRRQITSDPRLPAAMAVGVALARRGELRRLAEEALRERTPALERERQLVALGTVLGTARAAAFRERRDRRARGLGYKDLEHFYRSRYVGERARMDELAAELGCGESAVRGDLRRLGLGPDLRRSHGARWREQA